MMISAEQSRVFRTLFLAVVVTAVVSFAPCSVDAQTCYVFVPPPLLDTTGDGQAMPDIPRAFNIEAVSFGGHQVLAANTGNEIKLWLIDEPVSPVLLGTSDFDVPPYGDTDYNLDYLSLCDGCRYGVAGMGSAGRVLFDLGTSDLPEISDSVLLPLSHRMGAATFRHLDHQYLIANEISAACGDHAAVYLFDSLSADDLEVVGCLADGSGSAFNVAGGFVSAAPSGTYLFAADTAGRVMVYAIDDSGAAPVFNYVGHPFMATYRFGKGMAVDLEHDLVVTTLNGTSDPEIWDISNPETPVLAGTISHTLPGGVGFNRVALRFPQLWLAAATHTLHTHTFDISDPANPQPLDQGFWNPQYPWNSYSWARDQDAAFSTDGSALYVGRWSVLEVFEVETVFSDGLESGDTARWSTVE